MRYYSYRCIIVCYRILGFLMHMLQRFFPKTTDPLQRMWHLFQGDTRTSLQHRRPSHRALQKIRDKILYLYQRDFISSYVRVKPLIHQVRTRSEQKICQGSDKDKEMWGAWWSKVYGIAKLFPSLTSNLVTLTQTHTSMNKIENPAWHTGIVFYHSTL